MNSKMFKAFVLVAALLFVSSIAFENEASARAGGSRSSGSRGSRSYSSPSQTGTTAPQRQATQPAMQTAPAPQPMGGGFMRGLAGGIMGGLIGSMLFSSLGFAGTGGFGGSGIGLIEILLFLGLGYMIFRMIRKKKEQEQVPAYQTAQNAGYQAQDRPGYDQYRVAESPVMDAGTAGLAHVRQMDAAFDEKAFKDNAMDIFFKIQGAWMNRNLSSVNSLLTEEMKAVFQQDIDQLIRDKRVNRLENIAVRNVDITEVWQESGHDFITLLFQANLLDYTVNDSTGEVISGSKTDPVKFGEYWTFTRPVGNNPWKLTAINQA